MKLSPYVIGVIALVAALAIGLWQLVPRSPEQPPNFLVIIGDDMGVETMSCYGLNGDTAVTPTLDNLCLDGMRFSNAWSQPSCSPTRATLMTGRYGFRTGVGAAIPFPKEVAHDRRIPGRPLGAHRETNVAVHSHAPPGLRPDEVTLAMALKSVAELDYETAAIGKWHLADMNNGAFEHPNRAGFDHFAGTTFGPLQGYFTHSKQINGEPTGGTTVYPATDKVNEAIDWLSQRDGTRPWFMWFGFHNPHSPFHLPPVELLNSDAKKLDPYSDDVFDNPYPYFKAMLEGMDTEIGRLLGSLSQEQRDNTYVIFIGDNGTAGAVVQPPFSRGRSKGSVYQGGLNVPFMVSGPGVENGGVSEALVNTVDLFASVLDLAGIDPADILPDDRGFDSVSFAPALDDPDADRGREFAYADAFGNGPRQLRAIRNASHKLVVIDDVEELYDLRSDPYEHENLLLTELSPDAKTNYDDLKSRVEELLASEPGN